MTLGQSTSPLLSVVMPVYNGAPYLAAAIESILAQTQPDFEFIISDDGSTDESAAIIHAFAARDQRIRPLYLPHGGQAAAGNACVAAAQGRWLARMDADDLALPERLAVHLAWLTQHNVEIGGCAYVKQFGADERILWFPESHTAIQHELLFRVGLLQATMMLPTTLAKAHPYDEQCTFEDYEWQTRLACTYRFGNLPQVLLKRRAHPTQVHVQRNADFKADLHTYQRPYFWQLFPAATPADEAAMMRLLARAAYGSLAELTLAGQWLVRLADSQEPRLRAKMAERWRAACWYSTRLGPAVYSIYQQYAAPFQLQAATPALGLRLACTLRLRNDGASQRVYRRGKLAIGRLAGKLQDEGARFSAARMASRGVHHAA